MASNVSNLLKEKIVTPVANSVAAQVDSKVKNGIILRKFIGVQLGESNTGCQLVKIDLNKINVKDPSYEFTLYIKAFSQKGLFNFIINVNKTDSLQVDVKCEVKNSTSNNGEAIGYYDVDTVGNTITISLVKAFVVNTSINECKFVSTKDTLNISDLDIDWSDTGNVKTSTSINIRYNQTSIYEYDEYFYTYKPDFADGEMHQIAKFDFSEILNKTLTKNKNFDIIIDIIYHSIGEFHICFDLMWMRNLNTINMIHGAYEKIPSQSSMEGRNFDELFKFCKKDNTTLLLLINPPAMYISGGKFVIRRIEVHRADADIESDLVKIDLTPEKLVNSDGSLVIGSIKKHTIDFTKVFTPSDSDNAVTCNGVVPHPTTSEADNKYLLGADAKWHPRKAGNEYIANLKPTEEIKGLSETDTTKGISFVTIDFNTLSQKVVEAAPSTLQDFDINMKVLTHDLGIITISTCLSVTTAGLVACSGVLSDRGMGSRSVSFSTTYSGKLGAVTSPGFFVNDKDTKIFKIALYTPIAIDGVKIIDAVVTSYSDIIDESDIVFTWELGILEKKPYKPLTSNIIYPRIDLDRELVFDQMDIETPISETDEDTLFAEQIKHNGLVPAPGKYEVDNGYVLGADGTWKKMESGSNFTAVPITLDPTKYQEAYETQTNPDTSKKTIMFMNLDISSIVATGTNITKIELSMYSPIYGTSRLVIDTMINSIKNQYCVNEDANGAGFYMDYCLAIAEVENSGFTGKDDTKIESFYTFVIDGDIIKIGISPIIFKLLNGTTPPFPIVTLEDCKVFIQSITDGSTSTDISEIPISYEQSTYTLNSVYGANHNGWIAKNTIFSAYVDYDTRDFQSLHNGLVPAPTKVEVEEGKFLKADGTWAIPPSTRGNDNYITKVERDPSTVDQVSATKATSFLTIDYSTICEQLGAATGDGGQADANIFTSLEVMVPVWGKIQISIVSFLSDNWFNVLVYSDAGTGWYTDNIAYKIHSDISDNELHTRPGFYTMDDVNKTITLGMYGSYGADEIAIIDCTSIAVGEGFSVDDMIYNYDRQLIDIPESAKDFDEIGITRNTVFQSMAYADTDPDGTKYLYQRGNYNGLVPAPAKYDVTHNYMLRPNGTWGPIEGIIRNRTFTVTPYTDSSSTQTNDYVITEGAEDLAIAINENYSVDINIVFSGLGSKNNTNTTLIITGVTGTVNLYDYSGNPIKYITDGMSMKCTIFKNTIDDPVESMNAYCIYDIISYPDTMNGPSE